MAPDVSLWQRYRLRWRRRELLWRVFRARRHLEPVSDRVAAIRPGDILLFATVRNESERLPHFLDHYRGLGVSHFLIVDNDSTDGTRSLLAEQPDVSLWSTPRSYRDSRFGMDWLGWLHLRYGHGHWCVTVDADEILVYPDCDAKRLQEFTRWLDERDIKVMAAMMLELYPKGPLSSAPRAYDPVSALPWFDAHGYDWTWQARFGNISIRGGPRRRALFADQPEHAPHLHKTPLVKWHWRYAYASSTHILLPRHLNRGFDARLNHPTGILLHTKFLPQVIEKAAEEKVRAQHFTHPERYGEYYDALLAAPDLWTEDSLRYQGTEQLEALGLMWRGDWR